MKMQATLCGNIFGNNYVHILDASMDAVESFDACLVRSALAVKLALLSTFFSLCGEYLNALGKNQISARLG
jgi:hypothetical protein